MSKKLNSRSDTKAAFSAQEIAKILHFDSEKILSPTAEQAQVIEAALEFNPGRQYLVVAGAGSGKTETISQRVVWLIANGFVRPEQILGLTFTNKAAGELTERVTKRLQKFIAGTKTLAAELTAAQKECAATVEALLSESYNYPQIFTYNSFAAGIVAEFGAVAGTNPGKVIDYATAKILAEETIGDLDAHALSKLAVGSQTIAEYVKNLENSIVDNAANITEIQAEIAEIKALGSLPRNNPRARSPLDTKVSEAITAVTKTELLMPLVAAYSEQKRLRGMQEFSDQVAAATKIMLQDSAAVETVRERYRVILLDEVQDTSVGQTTLLKKLFAGLNVMGVGDPHQSIYGWRGASAAGLETFLANFARDNSGGNVLTLTTSFRNSKSVLAVANTIVAPLATLSRLDIPALQAGPNAKQGQVLLHHYQTDKEETRGIAAQIAQLRTETLAAGEKLPTIAVILRKTSLMPEVAAALRAQGVPYTIVSKGGLFATPEVTELLCLLRVVSKIDDSNSLVRFLTGPRFAIGLNDMRQLPKIARKLAKTDFRGAPLQKELMVKDSVVAAPESVVTIIQALDSFAALAPDNDIFSEVSAEGKKRLREAALMLRRLREFSHLNVIELLYRAERELRLDIELAAHPKLRNQNTGAHVIDPRSNIDKLTAEIANYLRAVPEAGLQEVLRWLDEAVAADELTAAEIAPNAETVQIITAHSAKGLEWDIVFVPQLTMGEMPSSNTKDANGWLSPGKLPDRLKQDAAARPQLQLRGINSQEDFVQKLEEYKTLLQEQHAADERRVAYVALTRAKEKLFLSYSFWKGQTKTPKKPSRYLEELSSAGILPELVTTPTSSENPQIGAGLTLTWPLDALGGRREKFFAAVQAVERASRQLQQQITRPQLSAVQELLVAEALERNKTFEIIPDKINASGFGAAIDNPKAYLLQQLRPIPQRPYRGAEVGNRFHEWVELRYSSPQAQQPTLLGLETEITQSPVQRPEYHEKTAQVAAKLRENFEQSKWADKQPLAVELQIMLPFAGMIMPCKMDAVFAWKLQDSSTKIEIVDWKTGKAPDKQDKDKILSKFLQLQLYRHAYAQEFKVPLETIGATLFYVSENQIFEIEELPEVAELSLSDLERLYREALATAQ